MIVTALVFVMTITTYSGGTETVTDIATWSDCERLRMRAEAVATKTGASNAGSCTQIRKVFVLPDPVQANVKVTPPAVTVTPAPVVVQPVNVTIKKE